MISVIIPTYNDGMQLLLAIESIQNQTYKDIEILVVDDFSTDGTQQRVEEVSKKDRRVKYYLNDYKDPNRIDKSGVNINAGYSARNFGLSQAKGEWITFQDGDDISFLNRLEIQLELVKRFNVSHLTSSIVHLEDKYVGQKLDLEKFVNKFPIDENMIKSKEIYNRAKAGIGLFAKFLPESIFSKISFELKRKRYINKLFFGHQLPYVGAANNPFFKRELTEKVKFRQLDFRVWPSLKGRGADRDFNYNLAYTYKDSIFVDIPLYCWRTPTAFEDQYGLEGFLK